MYNSQSVAAVPHDIARTACLASLQIKHLREKNEPHVDCIVRFLDDITERMRLEKFRSQGNVNLLEIDWLTAHIVTKMFLPQLSVGEDSAFIPRLLQVIDERIAAPLAKIVDAQGKLEELIDEELQQIEDICYRIAFKMSEFAHGIIFGVRHQYY
jgi:hypothetical protein